MYDAVVIGAGSGGVAFARRAALHNARVALVEVARFGGTCVNVGCIPKKIMWWASQVGDFVREARQYGFVTADGRDISEGMRLDWKYLKERRDANIKRLNGIYEANVRTSGIESFKGSAHFAPDARPRNRPGEPWTVTVRTESEERQLQAAHVLIATGSKASLMNVPGEAECTITSDQFWDLEHAPKRAAVIGAGYIAVELGCVLRGLEVPVDMFIRYEEVLRKFDSLIATNVTKNLCHQGIKLHAHARIKAFEAREDGKYITMDDDSCVGPFEVIIVAVGRSPNLEALQLENLEPGVEMTSDGGIHVDDFQNTSLLNLYAVGDVIQKVQLTPMAIAASRRLADRLFLRGYSKAKVSYLNVPSVVFAHPPAASVGLSEEEAQKTYPRILLYTNTAVNLYYNVFDMEPAKKPRIQIKIVVALDITSGEETVVGIHMVGMGADEVIQGFALAIGRSKAELDSAVAVHPSAAEEIVTCAPWGLPHPQNSVMRPLTTTTDAAACSPSESIS